MLVPVLSYIPLRMFVESWEESHRNLVLALDLLISGIITLAIAVTQDRKVGIEVFSRRAWTSELMESQDIFFHVPIRLAGVVMLITSCVFACI